MMSLTYSREQRESLMKTARAAGAVGSDPLVYRLFRERFGARKGESIPLSCADLKVLDYGSGPLAPHTWALRKAGYPNVWGLDLDLESCIENYVRCQAPFDVVLCSNVLNVQPSFDHVLSLLYELRELLKPGGTLIVNYPASPRKADLHIGDIRTAVTEVFGKYYKASAGGMETVFNKIADYPGVFVINKSWRFAERLSAEAEKLADLSNRMSPSNRTEVLLAAVRVRALSEEMKGECS